MREIDGLQRPEVHSGFVRWPVEYHLTTTQGPVEAIIGFNPNLASPKLIYTVNGNRAVCPAAYRQARASITHDPKVKPLIYRQVYACADGLEFPGWGRNSQVEVPLFGYARLLGLTRIIPPFSSETCQFKLKPSEWVKLQFLARKWLHDLAQ